MHTMNTLSNLLGTYGIGGALLVLFVVGLITCGFIGLIKVILFVSDILFGQDFIDSEG